MLGNSSAVLKGLGRLKEAIALDEAVVRRDPVNTSWLFNLASAQNWAMDQRSDRSGMPWAEKDMTIVLHEADLARLALPLCGTVKETVKALKIRLGYGLPQGSE